MFSQDNVTNEFKKHAEPLSGRSKHWDERQDQQYEQLRAG